MDRCTAIYDTNRIREQDEVRPVLDRTSKYKRYDSCCCSLSQLLAHFFQQITQYAFQASNKSVFAVNTSNQISARHAPKLVRNRWVITSSYEVIIPIRGA